MAIGRAGDLSKKTVFLRNWRLKWASLVLALIWYEESARTLGPMGRCGALHPLGDGEHHRLGLLGRALNGPVAAHWRHLPGGQDLEAAFTRPKQRRHGALRQANGPFCGGV
jgi:hypothetical protein